MNNNNEAMLYSTRPLKLLLKIKRERAKMLLYSRKDHKVNVKTITTRDPDSVKTSQLDWLKNYKVNRVKFSLIATRCNSEMHWHCRLTSYIACCLHISLYIRNPQSLGLYVCMRIVCMRDIFFNEIWAQDKIYILASTLFVLNILLITYF
jgi:hypothetical protein